MERYCVRDRVPVTDSFHDAVTCNDRVPLSSSFPLISSSISCLFPFLAFIPFLPCLSFPSLPLFSFSYSYSLALPSSFYPFPLSFILSFAFRFNVKVFNIGHLSVSFWDTPCVRDNMGNGYLLEHCNMYGRHRIDNVDPGRLWGVVGYV